MADEKAEHIEMYHLICKERFDNIDKKQDQIIDLLRGKNNSPGLIDEVRILKARWTIILGAMVILFTALITQIIKWLFTTL